MYGMMFGMFFWWIFGTVLFLALIAGVIWLLVRALRAPRQPQMPPPWYQQESPPYQRSAPGTGTQTYEEGGQRYSYPEQPSSPPPQAPPAQQEPRPRF
jgi:hypothetical protein